MIIPKKINNNQIKKYFEDNGFGNFLYLSKNKPLKVNQLISKEPYRPELIDLYMLHQFII